MSEFRDRAWGEANNLLSYAKEADSLLTQLIAMKNATGMLHIEDADEVNMILNAVGQYQAAKFLKYVEMKDALEAGDEYGNLKSHDEKQILDGCISLMWCVLGAVQDWLEYVSGDDGIICLHSLDDEERFGYSMGYSEIVRRLFLSGTGHSGGTSTAAKCRLLGVEYGKSIQFEFDPELEDEDE